MGKMTRRVHSQKQSNFRLMENEDEKDKEGGEDFVQTKYTLIFDRFKKVINPSTYWD